MKARPRHRAGRQPVVPGALVEIELVAVKKVP
jgi:hypothetical protein